MQRQPSSRMCFCCGRDNPIGLHLHFDYDGEYVWTSFTPAEVHQGYPGIMHGGIAYAILDEVIGRTAIAHDLWVVTAKMGIRYRQPVPLDQPLRARGEILDRKRRMVTARGEILLADGSVAVEALGTFVEAPPDVKAAWEEEARHWWVDEPVA